MLNGLCRVLSCACLQFQAECAEREKLAPKISEEEQTKQFESWLMELDRLEQEEEVRSWYHDDGKESTLCRVVLHFCLSQMFCRLYHTIGLSICRLAGIATATDCRNPRSVLTAVALVIPSKFRVARSLFLGFPLKPNKLNKI